MDTLQQKTGEQKAQENANRISKKFKISIKGAMTMLKGITGQDVCRLVDLIHGTGNNFNTVFLFPEFINGTTHLWYVVNKDNGQSLHLKKLPGGGSYPGENVEATTIRESHEECGFWPTRIELLKNEVFISKDRKVPGNPENGWNHHKLCFIVTKKTGFASTKNHKDGDVVALEKMPVKQLLADETLNRGHKALIKDFIDMVTYTDLGKVYPDLVGLR